MFTENLRIEGPFDMFWQFFFPFFFFFLLEQFIDETFLTISKRTNIILLQIPKLLQIGIL